MLVPLDGHESFLRVPAGDGRLMGYLPIPTRAMSEYSIETRSGSVVFFEGQSDAFRWHRYDHGFEVNSESLPALLAAVEQASRIAAKGAEFAWAYRDGYGEWVAVNETPRPSKVRPGPITPVDYVNVARVLPESSFGLMKVFADQVGDDPEVPVELIVALHDAVPTLEVTVRLVAAVDEAMAGWRISSETLLSGAE